MSFKNYDQQTFIADAAHAYTDRRISKREFLRRMGMAGVGFSAFGLGMLAATGAACAIRASSKALTPTGCPTAKPSG